MHGDEEGAVETALRELYKGVDIFRPSTNGLGRKSTELIDIELMSPLCEAKIFIDTECVRLRVRYIHQRTTFIRLTASVPMYS
jgi:hypothetical protein